MAKKRSAFYAYPSQPQSLGETIELAVNHISASNRALGLRSWRSLSIAGKVMIDQITRTIEQADFVACDLTFTNFNVLFELGFAIGRLKRVWISLNTTFEAAQRSYAKISPTLVPIGYAGYQNHLDLINALLFDRPWASPGESVLGDGFQMREPASETPSILYLKAPLNTQASITLSEEVERSIFASSLTTDDPREGLSPTLNWYAGKLLDSDAVLAHVLATDQVDAFSHNSRCSFVCGLAHGFGRHVFILAHEPFVCPVDYKHLLATHHSAEQCRRLFDNWIKAVQPKLPQRRRRRPHPPFDARIPLDLRHISLGEPVAENERAGLDDYFIETSVYYQALQADVSIVVGRRGMGKTATFYALERELTGSPGNEVCPIKPVGYEIDGLVRVLRQNIHRSERGYLIESLWKFLIYSELASRSADAITQRPVHVEVSEGEQRLTEFVHDNEAIIRPAFSVRLDRAVESLTGLEEIARAEDQRARISEQLHATILRELREVLGSALNQRNRVAILVDNLDEPWGRGEYVDSLSELLLGLFRVATDIHNEFRRADHWRKSVKVSVVIFIRSDIFYSIRRFASENDKLPIQRVVWSDPEMLLRIVDERLASSVKHSYLVDDIWQLFTPKVGSVPVKEFILANALPRPREVLFLVKEAVADAINRGHSIVSEADLIRAHETYSTHVFQSVLAEDDPVRGKLENILVEFAGVEGVMRRSEVERTIGQAVLNTADITYYFNLLCDIGFLGIETKGRYQFASDESDRETLRRVSQSVANRQGREESYLINPAFHPVLQIQWPTLSPPSFVSDLDEHPIS